MIAAAGRVTDRPSSFSTTNPFTHTGYPGGVVTFKDFAAALRRLSRTSAPAISSIRLKVFQQPAIIFSFSAARGRNQGNPDRFPIRVVSLYKLLP
jgi:hypothetical protein